MKKLMFLLSALAVASCVHTGKKKLLKQAKSRIKRSLNFMFHYILGFLMKMSLLFGWSGDLSWKTPTLI